MSHKLPPASSTRPSTRRQSVLESPAPPKNKTDKMKSSKEGADSSKDKSKEGTATSKESKQKGADQSKLDVAAEFNRFRTDLGRMLKDSEDKIRKADQRK